MHVPRLSAAHRTEPLDFVVVGGGIAGLSSACSLSAAGHTVTVIEQQSPTVLLRYRDGVHSAMTQLFVDWGIGDKIAQISTQINQATVLDGISGEELGFVPIDKVMEEFPAEFIAVQYGSLYRIFYDLAIELGVRLHYDSKVVSLDPWKATVTCEDGRLFTADVIIGADGAQSMVRPVVLGASAPPPEYDNFVIVSLVAPADIARQDDDLAALLDAKSWTVWCGDDCSLYGILTGPGQNQDYALIMAITIHNDALRKEFPLSFESLPLHLFEPRAQKLLKLSNQLYKTIFTHYPPFDNWVHESGRVVLVGEAAHPIMPASSLNTTTCIEDATTLSMLFSLPATKPQTHMLLSIYEELRQPRCAAVQRYVRRKREIITIPHGPGQRRRDELLRNQRSFHQADELDDEFMHSMYTSFIQIHGFNAREVVQDWWVKLGRSIFVHSPESESENEEEEAETDDPPAMVPIVVDAEVERDGPTFAIIPDSVIGEDEKVEACRQYQ